jgi:hypothetical protein
MSEDQKYISNDGILMPRSSQQDDIEFKLEYSSETGPKNFWVKWIARTITIVLWVILFFLARYWITERNLSLVDRLPPGVWFHLVETNGTYRVNAIHNIGCRVFTNLAVEFKAKIPPLAQ